MASYYHYTSPILPPHRISTSSSTRYSSPSRISHYTTAGLNTGSLVVPHSWFLNEVKVDTSRVLGKGSYGIVCLGEWLGVSVAVRKLHDSFFSSSLSEDERCLILKAFVREVGILFTLNHPNIVSFYGIHDSSSQGELSLISDTFLIQELLCVSLNARNRQKPRLTYRNVLDLSLGITGGLRYLHERSNPIIHQDLNTKNVLLSFSGIPKISDLGIAKALNCTLERFAEHARRPGTELYMPPEVKMADREDAKVGGAYDYRTDIYSLGVIILEMSIGRDPVASEAFRISETKGIEIVAETERRECDLNEVLESPLYHLILSCITCIEDRPDAINIHHKLKELMLESLYTSQPHTPVMLVHSEIPTNNCHQCSELQDKIELMQKEKKLLSENDVITPSPSPSPSHSPLASEKIGHLEATIRSRDNEISSLRQRNIQLEEELGKERTGTARTPPFKLTARGESFSKGGEGGERGDYDLSLELKATKKQLERYKDLTVELDERLKDTKIELAKYAQRQSSYNIHGEYEANALRSENRILRSEVERLRREAIHTSTYRHYTQLHYYK